MEDYPDKKMIRKKKQQKFITKPTKKNYKKDHKSIIKKFKKN